MLNSRETAHYCGRLIGHLADGDTGTEILRAYLDHIGVAYTCEKITIKAKPIRKSSLSDLSSILSGNGSDTPEDEILHWTFITDPKFALAEIKHYDDAFDVAHSMMVIEPNMLGSAYRYLRDNDVPYESFLIIKYHDRYALFLDEAADKEHGDFVFLSK